MEAEIKFRIKNLNDLLNNRNLENLPYNRKIKENLVI